MLCVACRVRPSPTHGLGLFSETAIPKGTCVWVFDPRVDRLYSADELASLPQYVSARIVHYGYRFTDRLWVLPGDDARFINHSGAPSCGEGLDGVEFLRSTVALIDIQPGDEITEDYDVSSRDGQAWSS